jgi:hypothetical protein
MVFTDGGGAGPGNANDPWSAASAAQAAAAAAYGSYGPPSGMGPAPPHLAQAVSGYPPGMHLPHDMVS